MDTVKCCKCCGQKLKNIRNTFCNCSCAVTYNNQHRSRKQNKEKNNGTKKLHFCLFCGKEIVRNDRSKFCTNECKKMHMVTNNRLSKYYSFNLDLLGTPDAITEYDRIKNLIYYEYWINGLSGEDLHKKYGGDPNISYLFKYLGIPTRTRSEAGINGVSNGKMIQLAGNQYHTQWHTTWEGKLVFLRSSFELDFAKDLDNQKILYDVEKLRIKYFDSKTNMYRNAIPDFYIPNSNTIIEIKSRYTLDILEMKDKVKSYIDHGYNFKLMLEHKYVDINDI